jgi:hypothetical protein
VATGFFEGGPLFFLRRAVSDSELLCSFGLSGCGGGRFFLRALGFKNDLEKI